MIVAEIMYEYEHRDLHINNIMVRRTEQPSITYLIQSRPYSVLTYGIRAFVIDNTFSRMRIGNNIYYTHLSRSLQKLVFNSMDVNKCRTMTDQDWIYVKMYRMAQEDWAQWLPKTNNYWLRFVIERLLSSKYLSIQINRNKPTVQQMRLLSNRLLHSDCLAEILQYL